GVVDAAQRPAAIGEHRGRVLAAATFDDGAGHRVKHADVILFVLASVAGNEKNRRGRRLMLHTAPPSNGGAWFRLRREASRSTERTLRPCRLICERGGAFLRARRPAPACQEIGLGLSPIYRGGDPAHRIHQARSAM